MEAYPSRPSSSRGSPFHRLRYRGKPAFGLKATKSGVPLDIFGRNIYLDMLNSAYGVGWRRENSFLAHPRTGVFCYGFFPFLKEQRGRASRETLRCNGQRYRFSVIGPASLRTSSGRAEGLPDYNPADADHVQRERAINRLAAEVVAGDKSCRPR